MKKLKNIIIVVFAYLGFLIGAGVATGQEILQYYTPNGYYMFGVGAIIVWILVVSNYLYAYAEKHSSILIGNPFVFYFGKKIGFLTDWFCTIFCFLTFIIMISGGTATLQQEYQLPLIVGVLIIAIITFISVAFGLLKFVKIIGFITPFIVVSVAIISIFNISFNYSSIPENINNINDGIIELTRAGSNWLFAGISNGGFCLLMLAKFTTQLSKNYSFKLINASSFISALLLVSLNVLIVFLCYLVLMLFIIHKFLTYIYLKIFLLF